MPRAERLLPSLLVLFGLGVANGEPLIGSSTRSGLAIKPAFRTVCIPLDVVRQPTPQHEPLDYDLRPSVVIYYANDPTEAFDDQTQLERKVRDIELLVPTPNADEVRLHDAILGRLQQASRAYRKEVQSDVNVLRAMICAPIAPAQSAFVWISNPTNYYMSESGSIELSLNWCSASRPTLHSVGIEFTIPFGTDNRLVTFPLAYPEVLEQVLQAIRRIEFGFSAPSASVPVLAPAYTLITKSRGNEEYVLLAGGGIDVAKETSASIRERVMVAMLKNGLFHRGSGAEFVVAASGRARFEMLIQALRAEAPNASYGGLGADARDAVSTIDPTRSGTSVGTSKERFVRTLADTDFGKQMLFGNVVMAGEFSDLILGSTKPSLPGESPGSGLIRKFVRERAGNIINMFGTVDGEAMTGIEYRYLNGIQNSGKSRCRVLTELFDSYVDRDLRIRAEKARQDADAKESVR